LNAIKTASLQIVVHWNYVLKKLSFIILSNDHTYCLCFTLKQTYKGLISISDKSYILVIKKIKKYTTNVRARQPLLSIRNIDDVFVQQLC